MLSIKDLKVKVEDKEILQGVTLKVTKGKVHALMGPNGSGKSTLAQALMGNPLYEITQGKLTLEGKDITELEPDEKARSGLFMSFQYPLEIPGVNIASYLRMIHNKRFDKKLSPVAFRKWVKDKLDLLELDQNFLKRYLNEGFSGGEKKKMELLQMLVLEPKVVILDELDSGLDIDAIKTAAKVVNHLRTDTGLTVLIITHYTRILKYIEPDHVHIMREGKIVQEGGQDLAHELEEKGYAPFGE